MSELNENQKKLAETLEGMIVVDAGPGTGKTHTIVSRYVNLISKPDVSPSDVLMLTFTKNAAAEMDERIKGKMAELGMEKDAKLVQTMTFDAFCMSIVLDSSDEVSEFFGIKETLTRAATLSENETINRDYFMQFLDQFLYDRGEDYGDTAVIATTNQESLMDLIYRLMSRGLVPLKKGWFGYNCDRDLYGDIDATLAALNDLNAPDSKGKSEASKAVDKIDADLIFEKPDTTGILSDDVLESAANDDREELVRFIHDVYYAYIRQSIADNRLTFGLNAMFAFTVLYNNKSVRDRNSYRYLMVDEFQDTNSNQMMISLMILKEPNLCVVGDWKQGIYGFRYVYIDNIVNFESKAVELRRFLNDDIERIPFRIPEAEKMSLDVNYRSSKLIIDTAYRCIYLKGSEKDEIDVEELDKHVVKLSQGRDDLNEEDTEVRYVQAENQDGEVQSVLKAVMNYVADPRYVVKKGEESRHVDFGDIAIICRTTRHCRAISKACADAGIPAFLQGDVEIMSTREGKLALAWLKFINNDSDPWGYVPIMADMDYTPVQIRRAKDNRLLVPEELLRQRNALYAKRRRITELLTEIFAFYNLDNDITQSIITTMSSIHRGSLATISDVIRIMEEDVARESTYPVENLIDGKAVTIMTMHKSKGLEFPVVICPFIDQRIMPSTQSDSNVFMFDETLGVRCTKEVGHFKDYSKICTSWKTLLVKKSQKRDYSEERRLLFVSLSRAKQYETVICGNKPSKFMDGLAEGRFTTIPDTDTSSIIKEGSLIPAPTIPEYKTRRTKIGVHEILHFEDSDGCGDGCDEVSGKGMEYGTEVHKIAELMCEGKSVPEGKYPEIPYIRKVLDSISCEDLRSPEIDCGLPVDGMDVTLRGVIDLLVLYPDRVEIHDYKTDVSDRFEKEYTVQLSIYAHAASRHYKKPAKCIIDYVSMGYSKEVGIVGMDEIAERVRQYMDNSYNTDKDTQA